MQSTSAISDTRYLELPLCWTIFSVSSVIFGLLLMCYFEHLNEVFEWILRFISGIRILICIWQSFVRKFVLSFFQHCSGNNLSSIIGKTKWKKFRQERSGFERPRKRSLHQNFSPLLPLRLTKINMEINGVLNKAYFGN